MTAVERLKCLASPTVENAEVGMPINIRTHALLPTMEKGNLAKWIKKESDKVKSRDAIANVKAIALSSEAVERAESPYYGRDYCH